VGRAELREAFDAAEPVEVTSVRNLWCRTAIIQDELALMNVVRTAE
jgi:hypothetical protein